RIVEATRQTAGVLAIARVARDHIAGRRPARPLGLAADIGIATQREALAADANAVTHRLAVAQHVVKAAFRGVDDDGTGLVARLVVNDAAAKFRLDLLGRKRRERELRVRNR